MKFRGWKFRGWAVVTAKTLKSHPSKICTYTVKGRISLVSFCNGYAVELIHYNVVRNFASKCAILCNWLTSSVHRCFSWFQLVAKQWWAKEFGTGILPLCSTIAKLLNVFALKVFCNCLQPHKCFLYWQVNNANSNKSVCTVNQFSWSHVCWCGCRIVILMEPALLCKHQRRL